MHNKFPSIVETFETLKVLETCPLDFFQKFHKWGIQPHATHSAFWQHDRAKYQVYRNNWQANTYYYSKTQILNYRQVIPDWDHCLKGGSCMSFSHKEIPLIDQFVKALVSLENLNRFRWHKARIKQLKEEAC